MIPRQPYGNRATDANTPPPPPAGRDVPHSESPSRKVQRIEVGVFLFLILPSMAASFLVVQQAHVDFAIRAAATILRDLALVALILFFLWRNDEPVASIGWVRRGAAKEVLLGAVLFLPLNLSIGLLGAALERLGFTRPAAPLQPILNPTDTGQILLGVLLVIIVAVSEETIFRGYLMLRAAAVRPGSVFAVVTSSLIFALGHGYEGSAGVVGVAAFGAFFAVIYLWRGSIIAPITIHLLQDLSGIVLAPLLGRPH